MILIGTRCVLFEVRSVTLYLPLHMVVLLFREVVSRRPLTMEIRVRSHDIPYEICGGHSGTVTVYPPSTSLIPCQYHSTNAPYLFSSECCYHQKRNRQNWGSYNQQRCFVIRREMDWKIMYVFCMLGLWNESDTLLRIYSYSNKPRYAAQQTRRAGISGVVRLKCDGTRAETRFRLSPKRTSPFKSAGASIQSTAGNRGVRIGGSNAGYTMFRGSVKGTGYPLHSSVSPSLPIPCAITFQTHSTSRWHPEMSAHYVVVGKGWGMSKSSSMLEGCVRKWS